MFGRTIRSSVSQQIVIYIFARVVLGTAKMMVHPKGEKASVVPGGGGGFGLITDPKVKKWLSDNGWVAFASLSWACVMYLFRWHPEDLQPSLRSSMTYMWVAAMTLETFGIRADFLILAMYNRTIGIVCGRCYGTTNEGQIERIGRNMSNGSDFNDRSCMATSCWIGCMDR